MAGNSSLTRTYDRLFTAAVENLQQNILFDNVTSRISLLYRMRDLDAIVQKPSSLNLPYAIYKEQVAAQFYTDLATLNITRGDPITRAIYDWKFVNAPVQVSGQDMVRTGEASVIPLLQIFIEDATLSVKAAIAGSTNGIFSSNGDSAEGFTGLQALLSSTPTTGTIGNINRATLTVWQNQTANVSSAFNTNGLDRMRTLSRLCSRGDEVVDTIVLNGSTWDNFLDALTSTINTNIPFAKAVADQNMMDIGFPNVGWFGALVIYDDAVPANLGYFMNLRKKYTHLVIHKDRMFELADFVRPSDKDALVSHVFVAGNLVVTNMARQGVLLNGDTA